MTLENSPRVRVGKGSKLDTTLTSKSDIPGPGYYKFNSTLSGPRYKFHKSRKGQYEQNTSVPGPGSYKIPSNFGIASNSTYKPK